MIFILFLTGCALACAALFLFLRRNVGKNKSIFVPGDADIGLADPMPTRVMRAIRSTDPQGQKTLKSQTAVATTVGLGLQGNLEQTPLHDFLQYLSLGRKSGILEITSGRRTGRIVVREGKVVKSSYRGKEGVEAVFLLLDNREGDFEFYEQALDESPQNPALDVVDVIMLWMSRKPKKRKT